MKKFIIAMILIGLGVFAMDRICEKIFWNIAQHANNILSTQMRNVAFHTQADVVLMGTSRCGNHYVPSIISDSIQMSVSNRGVGGTENIYAHYIALCLLTEHSTPKLICLDIWRWDLSTDFLRVSNPYLCLNRMAPYYGKNAEADSVFNESPNAWLYRTIRVSKYNSQVLSNIGGLFWDAGVDKQGGYLPLEPSPGLGKSPVVIHDALTTDQNKFKYLQKFVDKCRDKGIDIVFSISPGFEQDWTAEEFYQRLISFAAKNGISVYNNYTMFFDNPELFHDEVHMCDSGARKFSTLMGSHLKKYLEAKHRVSADSMGYWDERAMAR